MRHSVCLADVSNQFTKIIICLVINPITVDSFAALFNCTPQNFSNRIIATMGLSEPEFYVNPVYKFKNIMDRTDFSDQCRKK